MASYILRVFSVRTKLTRGPGRTCITSTYRVELVAPELKRKAVTTFTLDNHILDRLRMAKETSTISR